MIKPNYILYDIDDAIKLINTKTNNAKIFPLTPDTFDLVKKNIKNCYIFNPINYEIDHIHLKIIKEIKIFNNSFYEYFQKNNSEYNHLYYGIHESLVLLVSITIYLSEFLPQNGPWALSVNDEWKTFDEFDLMHFELLKKISKLHKVPNINHSFNFVTNFFVKNISLLSIYLIKNKKKYIFTGKRYGLKNLSKKLLLKSKKIKIIQLNYNHKFPFFFSFFNLFKCIFNFSNIFIIIPQSKKNDFIIKNLNFINKITQNVYVKNIIAVYSKQIIQYSENLEKLLDIDRIYLKKINPYYVISDHYRFLSSFSLGFNSKILRINNILISHGTHVYNNDKIANYANYLNAMGVLLSPYAKTTILQSPLAYQFITKQEKKYKYRCFQPIMWGYDEFYKKNNKLSKNIYILHAGSYKILSQRPWMYETSNEYLRGLSNLVDIINQLPNIKLIIRFRPKKELGINTLKNLLPKSNNYEISVHNKLVDDIIKSSLLISFSSTVIEESLKYRTPVLLWGGTNRYKHINVNNFMPNEYKRNCVYSSDGKKNLKQLIENIIKYHLNKPLNDDEVDQFVWLKDSFSKEKFIEEIINQEI